MESILKREPLLHVVKRDTIVWWKAWLIRLAAIVAALVVCAVFVYSVTQMNPLSVYAAMVKGAFGTARRSWITARDAMTLLCVALALAPAFKMRYWNIGGEGQVLMGALASAAVMIYCRDMNPVLLFAVMLAASVFAGVIWACVPAVFKAVWNTNETLFTLMMNYVAIQIVAYFITIWEKPVGSNSVGIINFENSEGWLPSIFGVPQLLHIIIVAALTVLLAVYINRTKHGYELSVVGESENTARYVGINVKKVIIRTMCLSGALCGIAGFLLVSGTDHTISVNTAGGRGFTAIIVAWLAKLNPLMMVLSSFLLVFLDKGAAEIASQFKFNGSASDVLTATILFFILGCEFFINYRVIFRGSKTEVSGK